MPWFSYPCIVNQYCFIGNGLLILSMTTIMKFVFQGINSIKILREVDIIHIKCDIQRILI